MEASSLRAISRTERGLVRRENEDNVLCLGEHALFAVADGMGGGEEGGLASRIVCEEIKKGVVSSDFSRRTDEIAGAVARANARIFEYAKDRGIRQMGSTVALLALDGPDGGRCAIGSVGDSRVYRLRNGKAVQLTRDHSVGVELAERVGASAGRRFASRSNPLAHILTRAIGTEPSVEIEWHKIDVRPDDRFLICSDGVHDVIGTDDLGRILSVGDLPTAASALDREVLRCGAPDNYSFVIVDAGGMS